MARTNNEELIQAAIRAFQEGREPSIRAAASAHGVSHSTVAHRLRGRNSNRESHAKQQRLSPIQEEQLVR